MHRPTAALARDAGARVCERFDDVKKSKGYAIEFLLESLGRSGELDSLDAVVIVDADTTIDPDLLRSFDQALRRGHDWIQAYYTVANPDQSWRTRLMTYAFSMFNGVMQLGQNALGSKRGLQGQRHVLLDPRPAPQALEVVRAGGRHGILVDAASRRREDLVRPRGRRSTARCSGRVEKHAANQRRRWEFGRGDIRKKYLGPLLRSADLGWGDKVLSTCELTIPSMATLALIYLVVAGLDVIAWCMTTGSTDSVMRACLVASPVVMTVGLCAYAISPFLVMRLPLKYVSTLLLFPFYVGWKLIISLAGRPRQWVRTAREPGAMNARGPGRNEPLRIGSRIC